MKIDCPAKREAVTKLVNEHPELPSLMLARMLFKKYPEWFSGVDAARNCIRKRRGANGNEARRKMKKHSSNYQDRTGFKWELPKSISEPWTSYELPQGMTLSLSDIHTPYHDDTALNAALSYGRKLNSGKGPDNILLNGDIVDFFTISRFEKDPRERNLGREINACRKLLGYLRQTFPKAKIIFKLGNHDERWEKWQYEKCPEYLDLPSMQIESILTHEVKATDKFEFQPEITGVEFVKDQRMIMAGKLAIMHGHEFPRGMSSPVNPARGNFLRGLECSLAGHLHRTSEHVEQTMLGKQIACWSQGCLCNLYPAFARVNKWNHGFSTVNLKGDKFEVNNLRVVKGLVYG
jgi:predicted phosphodiesterase